MDALVIKEMSMSCSLVKGNAVAWSGFLTEIYGEVSVIRPAECKMPGKKPTVDRFFKELHLLFG